MEINVVFIRRAIYTLCTCLIWEQESKRPEHKTYD